MCNWLTFHFLEKEKQIAFKVTINVYIYAVLQISVNKDVFYFFYRVIYFLLNDFSLQLILLTN